MEGESVWFCFQDIAKISLFPPQKYKNLFIFAVCLIIKFSKSMKSTFLQEFKDFAVKGNAIDMAVGVIIGGAFQKIVTSLVNDVIMPFIAIFMGRVNFSDLVITVGNSSIKYGSFITTIVDFLIIALSIFIAMKIFNKLPLTVTLSGYTRRREGK